MTQKFSKKEAIKFGWHRMKSDFLFFAAVLAAVGLVSYISRFGVILTAVSWILQIFLGMVIVRISVNIAEGKKVGFENLHQDYEKFFDFVIAYVLYYLIVLGGLVLLIVPGIIWAVKYQFFPYLIIDKGMKASDALKESARITKGARWDLFLFYFLNIGMNLLGMLAFFVGVFVTAPITMVAYAHVYGKLESSGK